MAGQFSVTILNLDDSGQLLCKNLIDVNYSQPDNVGSSIVGLTTDAAGAIIDPTSFIVSDTSGTVTFGVSFPGGTSLTGCAVTATISNGGKEEASDHKNNISVDCSRANPGRAPNAPDSLGLGHWPTTPPCAVRRVLRV